MNVRVKEGLSSERRNSIVLFYLCPADRRPSKVISKAFLIKPEKGTNSTHAPVHSRTIAGYFFSHVSLNSAKASNAGLLH